MPVDGTPDERNQQSSSATSQYAALHPRLAEAKLGMVIPGNVSSELTPEDHNQLDVSEASPYTSWTHSLLIAARFARSRGEGGIVLRVSLRPPSVGDLWSWHGSPDDFGEKEVLLKGVRMNVEVLHVQSWANLEDS